MGQKITFSQKQKAHTFDIKKENPFFKINSAEILSEDIKRTIMFNLQCKLKDYKGLLQEKSISVNQYQIIGNKFKFNIESLINNDSNLDSIELSINDIFSTYPDLKIDLYFETLNKISIINPTEDFERHLRDSSNVKILFSAPYGHGKTTFLKYFFDDSQARYEVFHLFPVNYSIAHNEDIFQYIKCELLFQLLGRDIEFEKEKFSKRFTFPEYAKENIDKILLPFLQLIPKVGGSIHAVINDLLKIKKNYIEFHNDIQIDDEDEAKKFIKKFYEKEGSIYEDNFYTQLIRQLINQIKEKGKQTILVIDDIDRMDPDHIFRILNVFAAHFDSQSYLEGTSNKFGFDKIIIVCDYDNLMKIFCHRYGQTTDYTGYIDKYFTKHIFRYNNKEAMNNFIDMLTRGKSNQDDHLNLLQIILKNLNEENKISLREILKIKQNSFSVTNPFSADERGLGHTPLNVIFYLCRSINPDILVEKFNTCIKAYEVYGFRNFYDRTSQAILVPLATNSVNSGVDCSYDYNGFTFLFKVDNYYVNDNQFYLPTFKEKPILPFSKSDFYELLIRLINQYKTLLNS